MQDAWQESAFSAFYRRHVNFVYGIAFSYLRNRADAEDITADLFVQMLEQGIRFPDDMQARAWMTVAIRNRCKNQLKNWFRSKRIDRDIPEQTPAAEPDSRLSAAVDCINRLPERYRLPLLLFAVEGYSVRETAEILKLNESTVRTRISRARKLVRKELEVDVL